ncbi:MAG TPA: type II secretion system F family protein [Aggregatilineales bacterium]|nr:type II secretion system F family protein [Anaerolineae bacterium]HUN08962.1 type II secretion system F family protein [Aggregatilineales bacterium]
MENLIPIFIVVILAVVGVLVYMGLRDDRNRDPLQDRLAQFGDREAPESLEEIELSLPFKDRVLLPIMRRLSDLVAKLTPQSQIDDTRKKLELAGMAGQIEPTTFFAMRIGATLGLALLAFMVFFVFAAERNPNAILYVAGGAGLGFILPVMWLQSKISRRQENILRALPDALDLLSICVEAGLGFDQAMGKIYEKWDNDLAIAFGRVLREIQLGKLRREALRDMAERMQVPDITSFTAAVIQADQLGVSLNKILRVQSDQMRVKRRQRAQEKAHQAPVKMMIPMVLLIFPSLWIVLLGPAVISLLNSGALGKI